MTAHPVTTAALSELLQHFVGSKLSKQPRTRGVDLFEVGNVRDADVRSVTAEGVEYYFYGRCYLVAWADLRGVATFGLDDRGNRSGVTAYGHIGVRAVAA